MKKSIALGAWLFCAVWLSGCAGLAPLPPPDRAPRTRTVYVVSNGWHTAIVIGRTELAATGLLPEADDFPGAAFLEFGWGDRTYYPARDPTLGMGLSALFTPTPAVMHVAALARPPGQTYANTTVADVALTQAGFRRLVASIVGEFERPAGRRAVRLSPGLYPDSNFYNARGTFYLFNTCNTWTARMLRVGGLNLSPSGVVTADELMERVHVAAGLERITGGS